MIVQKGEENSDSDSFTLGNRGNGKHNDVTESDQSDTRRYSRNTFDELIRILQSDCPYSFNKQNFRIWFSNHGFGDVYAFDEFWKYFEKYATDGDNIGYDEFSKAFIALQTRKSFIIELTSSLLFWGLFCALMSPLISIIRIIYENGEIVILIENVMRLAAGVAIVATHVNMVYREKQVEIQLLQMLEAMNSNERIYRVAMNDTSIAISRCSEETTMYSSLVKSWSGDFRRDENHSRTTQQLKEFLGGLSTQERSSLGLAPTFRFLDGISQKFSGESGNSRSGHWNTNGIESISPYSEV